MSLQYKLGLVLGMLVGAGVGILFVWLMKHKKVIDCHFDERQEQARGQAFKYAFFVLAVAFFCYGALDTIIGIPCDTLVGAFICFSLAMLIFAVICIRKEAYLSLYEKPKKVMLLFAGIALFNLAVSAVYLTEGSIVQNGILTFRACNLLVGLMLLIIMAIYALHLCTRRGEEAE